MYFHGYPYGGDLLALGFVLTLGGMVLWFRDVVQEGKFKNNKEKLQIHLKFLNSAPFLFNLTNAAVFEIFKNFLSEVFIIILITILSNFFIFFSFTFIETIISIYMHIKHKLNISKNSFVLGFKKAYEVPSSPDKWNKIYHHPLMRIFRVIGGIAFLMVIVNNNHLDFSLILQKILISLAFIQASLVLINMTIRLTYGICVLMFQKKKLEVRNSPLNKLASHIATAIYCAKLGCAVTGAAAAAVAAGASFDEVLASAGHSKIFVPLLGRSYNYVYGKFSSQETSVLTNPADTDSEAIPVSELLTKTKASGVKPSDEEKKGYGCSYF